MRADVKVSGTDRERENENEKEFVHIYTCVYEFISHAAKASCANISETNGSGSYI